MKKDKKWLKEAVRSNQSMVPGFKGYISTINATSLINQLDEPEKPVIPQFVAEHIERSKQMGKRLNVALSESPETEMVLQMGITIFEANKIYARAWLDGYEVEKEPQWVVVRNCMYIKNLYFGEMNDDYRVGSIADKEQAMVFTDKAKAEAVALLVDGEVKEVAE